MADTSPSPRLLAASLTVGLTGVLALLSAPLVSTLEEFGRYPNYLQTRSVLPFAAVLWAVLFFVLAWGIGRSPARQMTWICLLATTFALSRYTYNFLWLPGEVNAGPFQPMSQIAHVAFWFTTVALWGAWAVGRWRPSAFAFHATILLDRKSVV